MTKSTTPIHKGRGTIESHFWIKLPLKLFKLKPYFVIPNALVTF